MARSGVTKHGGVGQARPLSQTRYEVYKQMLEERKRLRELEEIEARYQVETDDIRDQVGVPSAAIWHQEKIKPR